MTKQFHAVIHSAPAPDSKFACSFEEVVIALESLPRMFLELDGSFVWVIEDSNGRFQLDGLLVDNGTSLLACELKGACNAKILDRFLTALGWPDQQIVFQLVQQGVFLSEGDFRHEFIVS